MTEILDLLQETVTREGSDLHLSAGLVPAIRVNGEIQKITELQPLTSESIEKLIYDVMSEKRRKIFEQDLEVDFSIEVESIGRFRVNCFHQMRGAAAVFRQIPVEIPSLEDIQAPDIFNDIIRLTKGLVLVTGSTGSGKSTTLAAMINEINQHRKAHILTIEDPIEFVYPPSECVVNQREVIRDTKSFAAALRSAMREDPDVILVGELRDVETIRLALTAAETGQLVFGTMHTMSAIKSIDRIIDVFPASEKEMVKSALSESLQAIISQVLLKRDSDTGGRVAAREILLCNPAIRALIRDHKLSQMYSIMQVNTAAGMRTLDQELKRLLDAGTISYFTAAHYALHKDTFTQAQELGRSTIRH